MTKAGDRETIFVSFGDSRMADAARRIRAQAEAMNVFDRICVWNENDLDTAFRERFVDRLVPGSRGFGFWCWKPHVIKTCLDAMRDGDILLYTDIGCHLRTEGRETLLEYFECARNSPSGVFGFSGERGASFLKHYVKGDILAYFGVYDDDWICDSPGFIAGAIAVARKPESMALIRRWEKAYEDDFELATDSPSRVPNKPGFIRNLHDQALFSVLCTMYGAACRKGDAIEATAPNFWKAEKPHPIAALRDKGLPHHNSDLFPRWLKMLLGCIPYKPLRKGIGTWYKLRKAARIGEALKRSLRGSTAGQGNNHERQ
ncbi:MAG: hypothetical protein LBT97_13940 [Planctomycetota bacterium]|jgi:hypothetical protein|nr:hypothetical protein [Planctomycetota bacterium]